MNYGEYKQLVIGKRIDYDGGMGYQCIDLFKSYMAHVFGIEIKKSGNAKDLWTNRYRVFDSNWIKLAGTNDLKQGDIAVAIKGKYGHVAVIDNPITGDVLEQNGSGKRSGNGLGPNAVRIHNYPKNFRVGVRRHK